MSSADYGMDFKTEIVTRKYEVQGGARDGLQTSHKLSALVVLTNSTMATGRMPQTTGNLERIKIVGEEVRPYQTQ